MSVLVLGGYGAVGGHIVDLLRSDGWEAAAVGRDPARADVRLDLANHDAFTQALAGASCVVNASGAEDPRLAEIAASASVPFVEISATTAYARALEALDGAILIGVWIAPGLSGILAREIFTPTTDSIDMAVGLGAGEKHGAAATEWTYGLLGRRFVDPDGSSVKNFTARKSIPFPPESGYRRWACLRADFADQHRLTDELGIPVRTYLRLDSRMMTVGLGALTYAPWAAKLSPTSMRGGDRWAIVARANDDRSIWATGRSQSYATAVVAAWSVGAILRRRLELVRPSWLHGAATLDDLATALGSAGVQVQAQRPRG